MATDRSVQTLPPKFAPSPNFGRCAKHLISLSIRGRPSTAVYSFGRSIVIQLPPLFHSVPLERHILAVIHSPSFPVDKIDLSHRYSTAVLRLSWQPNALNPYEPTAARGYLVKNPGFIALMKDPELGKHLPLLNMILPLYNEQAAGAVTTGAQVNNTSKTRA